MARARLAAIVSFLLLSALAGAGSSSAASTGNTIIFAATTADVHVDQLFSIQPSGEGLKQITTGSYPSDAPAFSPNGKRVAFERLGVGILTMNPDGSGLHRVTTNPRDSFPTWSPDGSHIAFVRPQGARWIPFIVATKGGAPKALKKSPPAGRPSWTTGGLLIASGGDVVKIDTKTGRVLKYLGADIDAIWGLNTVTLSPSRALLAFVGARDPIPGDKECGDGVCQRFGLYLQTMLPKPKRPQMIVRDAGPAAFAADGKRIVYAAGGQLYIRSVATGITTPIPTTGATPTGSAPPAWR
jgi:dipeptidyl aminopeptidase/acylaminoacyl peptidase